MAGWVRAVCRLPVVYRREEASIHDLMTPAGPHLRDRAAFRSAVRDGLAGHPDLVEAWRTYSADKRTGAGPYFGRADHPNEVGFYDSGADGARFQDATVHDPVDACADFIHREARWVLTGARGDAGR